MIDFINPFTEAPLDLTAHGLVERDNVAFPFRNGAYRIVTDNNYAESFGFQWNKFTKTQIDKSADLELSEKRFFTTTGWQPGDQGAPAGCEYLGQGFHPGVRRKSEI